MTPQEIDALPEYTLEQRLKLVQHIIVQVTSRKDQSYSVRGRQYTLRNLSELTAEEQRLKEEIAAQAAADDGNDGVALATFGRPR